MYVATKEIGGYKVGAVVPDRLAETWLAQYAVPHVKKLKNGEKPPKVGTEDSEPEKTAPDKGAASDALLDDYLNRNKFVIIKNVRKDNLSKDQIEKMIDYESKNKNRNSILNALKNKIL